MAAGSLVASGRAGPVAVEVATATPRPTADTSAQTFPFPVHYRPMPWRLLGAHLRADVVLHNSLSLRFAWPLLLASRPWVIVHAAPLAATGLRHRIVAKAGNVAVSSAIARSVPAPATVIPNAYRAGIFRDAGGRDRGYAFGFLGRLVSDKGAADLLDAVAVLGERDLRPRVAIIGDGPERAALEAQAVRLGISGQIDFLGPRRDREVAQALNDITCLVVPSVWNEPFGIVALEGIACGCVVIGSQGGGLADAIGPCGLTYPNGDVGALAERLERMLREPNLVEESRAKAAVHLARHTPEAVVDAYLDAIGAMFPQLRLRK